MSIESQQVKEINCTTAKEFLDSISEPLGEPVPPHFRNLWVYRGHGDAGWELKPAAWREEWRNKLGKLHDWLRSQFDELGGTSRWPANLRAKCDQLPHYVEWAIRWNTELLAVRQYCDLADEIGLTIPNAAEIPNIEQILTWLGVGNCGVELHSSISWHVPFAFAQHHGVPTQLLDWTRDPMFAAFFALEHQPCEKNRLTQLMCVWAVNSRPLANLSWITVPRGQHPFVHAQNSLFSLQNEGRFWEIGQWPCVQHTWRLVLESSTQARKAVQQQLWKWTLPLTQSEDLRKQLFMRRVSRSRLMPTLDNVGADTMRLWNWL